MITHTIRMALGIEVHNISKGKFTHSNEYTRFCFVFKNNNNKKTFSRISVSKIDLLFECHAHSPFDFFQYHSSAQQKKSIHSLTLNYCDVVHLLTYVKDAIF